MGWCFCGDFRSGDAVVHESLFGTQAANGVDSNLLGIGCDGDRRIRFLGIHPSPSRLHGAEELSESCSGRGDICGVQFGVGLVVSKSAQVGNEPTNPNVMLGVKCDNRESVHGPKKVALTPNIGLDVLQC